ncbi:MAG: dNTP triphosphohydrolase [candidate division KSB1 bacterium]|nr:dNTP triphosphohydrolase [candidate division KSB1 bacterium]
MASLHFRTREELEAIEERTLAPYASLSRGAGASRVHQEPEHPYRTAFQRDRDRIVHSRAFRRLKHKRQVFLTDSGDHYRTRITHTMEVSQLARTLARALGLNEDLTEAIALGHDLGHTPFGHIGETVLHRIMTGQDLLDGLLDGKDLGGFKHNYQSLRVVDQIEMKYAWPGLNLTAPVREGILKHTGLLRGAVRYPEMKLEGLHYDCDFPVSLEGQVVAICDEIAQRTHDLEDGLRAGFVALERIREVQLVREVEAERGLGPLLKGNPFLYRNQIIRALIEALVTDVLQETLRRLQDYVRRKGMRREFDEEIVAFSARMDPLQAELDEFIDREIIYTATIFRADDEAVALLRHLFRSYLEDPGRLPDYVLERVPQPDRVPESRTSSGPTSGSEERKRLARVVCDHVAGMTDNFALGEAIRLGYSGTLRWLRRTETPASGEPDREDT